VVAEWHHRYHRATHCHGPVEAAHVQSWARSRSDTKNLVPLCVGHHRMFARSLHTVGITTFQQINLGLNLDVEAHTYWDWFAHGVPFLDFS
jgi:predicted restriction endonuclease